MLRETRIIFLLMELETDVGKMEVCKSAHKHYSVDQASLSKCEFPSAFTHSSLLNGLIQSWYRCLPFLLLTSSSYTTLLFVSFFTARDETHLFDHPSLELLFFSLIFHKCKILWKSYLTSFYRNENHVVISRTSLGLNGI